MKKLISLTLCLMLVLTMALPVMAAGPKLIYTDDSSFDVGGTVTIDYYKTLESVYNNGKSEEFNAYYEGNVQYYWMRNDVYYADGMSLTITEADKGCQFYCIAALYDDADHTEQVGALYSDTFSVPNTDNSSKFPEITTEALPDGTVGEEYYFKLECTDPDATFSLLRSSLPDGLYLTQHGEIEGTPTKTGMWYVVIMATPEAGAEYATTAEFEFYINESGNTYSLEIMRLPNKVVYTAGEKLDMKGLWVRIYTPDGYINSYDGKYLEYSQKALTTLGEQKIKISYEDAFEFFIVTVVASDETEPEETEPDVTEPEETEPEESEKTTESTEKDKTPGENSGKKPDKDSGKDSGKNSGKDSGKDTTEGKENDNTGNTSVSAGGSNLMLILVIVLGVVAAAAIAALVIVLIKKKK